MLCLRHALVISFGLLGSTLASRGLAMESPAAAPVAPESAQGPASAAEPTVGAPGAPGAQPVALPSSEPRNPPSAADGAARAVEVANPDNQQPLTLEDDDPGALGSAARGSPIKIYGFADFGYRQLFVPKDSPWLLFLNRKPSFSVGNVNVYFDSQLAQRWRALAEVRFTYLPNGAPDTTLNTDTVGRTNNNISDYTDFSRNHPVGGIILQRATLEYSAFSWLTVAAGHWLTPYGIWNVDHGSPVIIGVAPPFIIGAELLPASQVGLLAQGSATLVPDLEFSYALGLSNGRSNLIPYEDLDNNKAITARVALTYRGLGDLTLGATVYNGRSTVGTNQLYVTSDGPRSRLNVGEQFDEVSYASDLRWVWRDFHLQTEWILNDRRYTDRGRPLGPNGGLRADKRNFGGYGLVGYRTSLFGIMPYIKGEYSPEPQSQAIGVADQIAIITGGLNFRPEARVVLKAEYTYGYFPGADPKGFGGNSIQGLDMQAAWAF
jgi:hypothetical protein